MRIGVLGTGTVGRALAGKLDELGHEVVMGSRDPEATAARREAGPRGGPSFAEWHADHVGVVLGAFADAARHGELLFLATSGEGALSALGSADPADLHAKTLVDVTNPIDASSGFPPTFFVTNTDSLAEQVQRAHPEAHVVKSLNTVTAAVMVEPGSVAEGRHTMFTAGDDAGAKDQVANALREWFGWQEVIDLGDLTAARSMEMYLALWIRLLGVLETSMFNVAVVR